MHFLTNLSGTDLLKLLGIGLMIAIFVKGMVTKPRGGDGTGNGGNNNNGNSMNQSHPQQFNQNNQSNINQGNNNNGINQ